MLFLLNSNKFDAGEMSPKTGEVAIIKRQKTHKASQNALGNDNPSSHSLTANLVLKNSPYR